MPYQNYVRLFTLLISGFIGWGCHEEPTLPTTLIPFGCLIGQIDFVDTTSTPSYTYQYDQFGNRLSSIDDRGSRVFKYSADHLYITSQQVNGVTLTYQYDSTNSAKRISRITGGSLTYNYSYEGDNLKTYVSTEGGTTSTYSFTNGKLTGLTVNPGPVYEVNDEKISKSTDSQGNVINYTYTQGQLTQTEYIYPATKVRKVITYSYDNKAYYSNTGLLARGFPGSATTGQPGPGLDGIGSPVQLHNFSTITTKIFKTDTGVDQLVSSQILTYQHQYNRDNYSLGYGRSDGARARYYYTNCAN